MFYPTGPLRDPVALQSAQEASSEARRAGDKVERLQFDVDRLLMITEALWMILKEEHGYDDAELQRRVTEIDMRDGKLDGRAPRPAPVRCLQCGKTLLKRRPRCIYCGHAAPPNLFEK
jgi:hypothetical protein